MKFQIDHDMHIHSYISPCAGNDLRQTKEAILTYGLTNSFRLLNLADHIWDEKSPWECKNLWLNHGNDMARARSILPLPQSKYCNFLFGMEIDMDMNGNIAASPAEMEQLDFLVFAPSHLHLKGFTVPENLDPSAEVHKNWYMARMNRLLSMDIPFHKSGLAHPTCSLACVEHPIEMFDIISDREYEDMWGRMRDLGMGVEINMPDGYTPDHLERILRPYRIAKAMGCKFYLGGDAHTPEAYRGKLALFRKYVDLLELTEEDKHPFVREHLAPLPGAR